MTLNLTSQSPSDTEKIGAYLAELLEKNNIERAFIALKGEMGVGKTAFVRGFCSHLGIFTVKSPTYTVLNEYAGRKNVHHFDLYRISDGDDLYSVGFDDAVDSPGYCLAEWSENAEDYLREEPITVSISRTSFGDSATDTEALVRKIDITIPNLEII